MKLLKLTKPCIKCGEIKRLSQFPKYKSRKGKIMHQNVCKACRAVYVHNHYVNNRELYLSRSKAQKDRNPKKYKEYLKAYYREHREERKSKDREYAMSHREHINAYHRYWRSLPQNSIKKDAWKMVQLALKFNILVRPDTCSKCGVKCKPEAHHPDYSKPLDVIWLCKSCHENVHHLNEEDTSKE